MMINKRLIGAVPESKKYIAGNVALQWCSLCANIAMMSAVTALLASLFAGEVTQSKIVTTAVIALAAVAVRYGCTVGASRMGYLSSKAVKKTLRGAIYDKLLCLGASYSEQVKTSEVVQVAVEGVDQLETYFGAYLPQFFYAMLAPLTLFVVLCFVSVPAAVVLLVCVPLIPVAIAAVQTWAKKLLSKYWGQYTALGDTFLENLQGLTTLKIYQADAFKNDEMNVEAEKFRKITMKVLTMQLNSITIMDLIAYGGAALGVIMAATQLRAGKIDLAGALLIILLAADFFIPMRQLGSFFHIAMNGMAASDKIFRLLDLPEPEQGGVFVHPVDVPLTRRLTLLALLRTADAVPGTALQAAFCGEPGHPVYLPLSLVPAILAHDGREGLRGALASVPCRQVPVADAAMLLDMDTPEQYADLQDRAACHDALTRDEAEGLLLQAGVPERGLRHALAVGRVAEALCAALTEARGEKAPVETALALASGLTHDICKGVHGHEAAGGRLLARLGLARMAAIVAAHRDQSVPAEKKLGAHELVYLADKYCRGGIWVPVAQRFAQKLEEFGADPGARAGIEGRRDRALALERRLAVELGRDPAQLAREVLDTADIGTRAQMLDARRALWTPLCPLGEEA